MPDKIRLPIPGSWRGDSSLIRLSRLKISIVNDTKSIRKSRLTHHVLFPLVFSFSSRMLENKFENKNENRNIYLVFVEIIETLMNNNKLGK